jgi:hypothetical protein
VTSPAAISDLHIYYTQGQIYELTSLSSHMIV